MLNRYFWAALAWTAAITVSCLLSADTVDKVSLINIPHKDKIAHFVFYFVFTLLWSKYFRSLHRDGKKARLMVFLFAVGWGILIEFCQMLFTEQRSADTLEALANITGSITAIIAIWLYRRNKD